MINETWVGIKQWASFILELAKIIITMKKHLLTLLLMLFLCKAAFSQITISEDGEPFIEEVVLTDSLSKKEAYYRAKVWIASTFKSSDEQIVYDEAEFSNIIGTGNILLPPTSGSFVYVKDRIVNFKLAIFFKEGRYKYRLDNIVFSQTIVGDSESTSTLTLQQWYEVLHEMEAKSKNKQSKRLVHFNEVLKEVEEALVQTIESMKSSITKPKELDNDW